MSVSKLKEIEPSAFSGCSGLKEICLLNIETIGEKAFYFCTALNSVEITSAGTIGNYAFYGCSSLLSVELGPEIQSIGTDAFGYSADGLTIPNFFINGYADTAAEIYAKSHNILFYEKYEQLTFYYYNYYTNKGKREIYISYVNKYVTGNVVIPSSYSGYTISKIGDYAFEYCCFITEIKLPATVTTLGSKAFSECSNLKSINCDSVTSLGSYAFNVCSSLQSISLPSVTAIAKYCFSDCGSLSYANLPLVTSIGEAAFRECANLKTVTCPCLETAAFASFVDDCSLLSIDLQNIKKIGAQAFVFCTSLKTVYLLCAVSFGLAVFDGCSSDLTVYVHKGSAAESYAAANKLKFTEVESVMSGVYPAVVDNENSLLYGLSPGIKSLEGYISSMPDDFKIMYTETSNGFGTGTVVNVILFNEIVSTYTIFIFGDATGDGNIDATDADTCIEVENGVIKWSKETDGCFYKAADINGDGNVDTMDADVISDAANGRMSINQNTGRIILPDPSSAVNSTSKMVLSLLPAWDIRKSETYINEGYTYTVIGSTAMITGYTGAGGNITIPDSLNGYTVTAIDYAAFAGNTKITGVIIPDTVTSIDRAAFSACTELVNVKLPSNITGICEAVFSSCYKLTGLTIPNKVTHIDSNAFLFCHSIVSINIPQSVVSIDTYAFYQCRGLNQINVDDGNTIFSSKDGVLFNKAKTSIILCPSGKAGHYMIPDGVIAILGSAFRYCTFLTGVTFPKSLSNIGSSAFSNCTSLAEAYFLGNAPTMTPATNNTVFKNCASGFKVFYVSGKTGFTNPWYGYTTEAFIPVTITFDADGGNGGTVDFRKPGQILTEPIVTKPGYTFAGWSPNVPAIVPGEDTTYTAQWIENSHVSITFNANGGLGGTSLSLAWGSILTAPAVSRKGYTFAGWLPAVPPNVPIENATYTAQWTYDGTVDINLEAGWYDSKTDKFTPINPGETLREGDVLTVRICPQNDFFVGVTRYVVMFSKEYYSIIGLNKAAFTPNLNNSFYLAAAPDYTGSTNITAGAWPAAFSASENYNVYTAVAVNNRANTNSANGGHPGILPGSWLFSFNLLVTKDIVAGSDARIWMDDRWVRGPGNTTGASYFAKCQEGQYSSLGDSISYNYAVDMDGADLSLPLAGGVSTGCTIYFHCNGGASISPLTVEPGSCLLPQLPIPSRQGYTFAGWSPAPPETAPAGVLTLSAVWNRIPVTISAASGSSAIINDTNHLIYGLEKGISSTFISSIIKINGDGRLEITSLTGTLGTGTKVELIDNVSGLAAATYYIVIFGDVNGDGNIDAADADTCIDVQNWKMQWSRESQPYFFEAGDLNGDGNVDTIDADILSEVSNWRMRIDQTSGLAVPR